MSHTEISWGLLTWSWHSELEHLAYFASCTVCIFCTQAYLWPIYCFHWMATSSLVDKHIAVHPPANTNASCRHFLYTALTANWCVCSVCVCLSVCSFRSLVSSSFWRALQKAHSGPSFVICCCSVITPSWASFSVSNETQTHAHVHSCSQPQG